MVCSSMEQIGNRGRAISALARAEGDAAFRQIVGCELYGHAIAREDADVMFTHLAGDVRGHDVTVIELYAKQSVGERLDDRPLHLYVFFFGHAVNGSLGCLGGVSCRTRPRG